MKNSKHPEVLTETQENLCASLFKIGAIAFGNFRYKLHERFPEAPLAPDYINLRMLQRYPEVKTSAVNSYLELMENLDFELVAGIPVAATVLASSIADSLKTGMITPRITEKTHGSGAKADGFLTGDKGKKVVLIDDLITGADAKFEAINLLESLGLIIENIIVLIDREQGGKEELMKKGYHLHAAMKRSQMLDFYLRTGLISKTTYEDVQKKTILLNDYLKSRR